MVRTQIQLTEEQARRVKQIAAERQVSMATVIRQGVEMLLDQERGAVSREQRVGRALSAAGRFRSGGGDGAREHDRHLAAAIDG